MTREEIAAVLEKHPHLTPCGLGLSREDAKGITETGRSVSDWLAGPRAEFLDEWHVDACTRAECWLKDKAKIKTPSLSSYWLKHRAEEEVGYITDGDFIVAVIHLGFPIKEDWYSINPLIGISRKFMKGRVISPEMRAF
jgi:hypothetical protein